MSSLPPRGAAAERTGPRISVIIPSYNGAALLPACLDALLGQTLPADEVIVVDDGSSDGSCALVRARYPQVTLLALPANGGFCRAANAGLRAAGGELLALLNNDVEADAGWLAALTAALAAQPDVGSCASRMLFHDQRDRVSSAGLFVRVDGVARDIGHGEPDGPRFAAPALVFGASAGAALYRRALLADVGLFDEDLVAYAEDVDLAFRAQWRGWRCLYVPPAVAYHRVGATYGAASAAAAYYGSRNALVVVCKNMPDRVLRRHWSAIVAAQAYQVAYLTARGHGWPALRGKLDALRMLKRTREKRRAIQETRRATDAEIETLLCPPGRHGRFAASAQGTGS